MEATKYENYQDFIMAFDSTPEEIIKRETYDLLKLYNQTQQQLATYKQKEDKLIKWCYEHGQAINATDILDIIDPTILEGDK